MASIVSGSSGPIHSAEDLGGRRAVVLGLARSGVAAARFLADQGAVVAAYDRRSAAELADAVASLGARPVRLALGVDQLAAEALLQHADLIVTSPSISARFPTTEPWLREALGAAEERGTEIVSEIDLFLRLTRARILGVTGTKGKTTTASLVAAILEAAGVETVLGGNIGTPLVDRALELSDEAWAVVELSELQLPTISRGADVALYTNVGADHLDRHGTEAAYRAVKARLAQLSVATGRVVLNRDDPGCRELGATLNPGRVAWYGLEGGPDPGLDAWLDGGVLRLVAGPILPTADLRLPGRHMAANALGAALAAHLAGVAVDRIGPGLAAFEGVPHRLELVAERDGVRWVNDSQATIPMAAIAALEAFDAPVVLVAGGKDKGLDYRELADAIASRCRAVVLIGETADALAAAIDGRVTTKRAASMDEAVRMAADAARPGDVALLSPAAASFDMFTDYAARGDAFRAAVAGLEERT